MRHGTGLSISGGKSDRRGEIIGFVIVQDDMQYICTYSPFEKFQGPYGQDIALQQYTVEN